MAFAAFMDKPSLSKKILVIFMILLALFFGLVLVPQAQAMSFAPLLGTLVGGVSLSTLGVGLLVVGVIAAGVYVGTHTDEISEAIGNLGSKITSMWGSLESGVKTNFETLANNNTFDYASTSDQTIQVNQAARDVSKIMLLENVFFMPAADSVYPLPTTHGTQSIDDTFVNTYKALEVGSYVLVPSWINSVSGLKQVFYSWYIKQSGIWTKESPSWIVRDDMNAWGSGNATGYPNYYPATDSLKFEEFTGISSAADIWISQRAAVKTSMTIAVKDYTKLHWTIPSGVSNYKQWLEKYYQNVTVTAAPWVLNPAVVPENDAIVVPPGVISGTQSGTKTLTVTEAIATDIATVNFPVPPPPVGTTPKPPTSKWNPFGWLKYLVDWFVWIIVTVLYFVTQTYNRLKILNQQTEGLRVVLVAFFSVIPPPVMSLFTLAILFSILGALIRRK